MTQKLLVLSSGTTAAEAAREVQRQWRIRKANGLSELEVMVRYIDIADLSSRGFLMGEWFPLSIDNQFMDAINEKPEEHFPQLKGFLFPGRLPETTSDGGGGIRYNGAGTVILNREKLQTWIKDSMDNLGNMGDGNTDFAVALVISAVGATGSGTIERLLESVISAVRAINPNRDPQVDVFILLPGTQKVTPLGEANTVALFAEMAASRLAGTNTSVRRHKGRTILVGWGSKHRINSIEQLEEAAATLIRIINDPITEIASEYRQRAVDNYMLHDTDPYTHLPSHLSSATAVTIGLGNLEEQIIQLDAERLLHGLAFGDSSTKTSDDQQAQASTLHDAILGFLNGDDDASRYDHLLESLCEGVTLDTQLLSLETIQRMPANQRAAKLTAEWQADKDMLQGPGRSAMERKANELIRKALRDLLEGRRHGVATGHTLSKIHDDYQALHTLLVAVRKLAHDYTPPASDSDEEVTNKITALNRGGLFQGGASRNALGSIQENIRSRRLREANRVANSVLKAIDAHCAKALNDLEVILKETRQQRNQILDSSASELPLHIETDHRLHMAALSNEQEIKRYYQQVSIFQASTTEEQRDAFLLEDAPIYDPLADFRREMEKQLDAFFTGDYKAVSKIVHDFTATRIHENIKDHSVVDVLLKAGEDVLYKRLNEAASKAHSLVNITPDLASSSREVRHVCAWYKGDAQRDKLQTAMRETFRQGECTLLESKDPTEIVVFYYVDGFSMSAVKDLSGSCFKKFLDYRRGYNPNSDMLSTTATRIPVYNGKDSEDLVHRTGVINYLYKFRDRSIVTTEYGPNDVPELGLYQPTPVSPERESVNNAKSAANGNQGESDGVNGNGNAPPNARSKKQNGTTSRKQPESHS